MDDVQARAIVCRLLVIESAQSAGLLVATPVGGAGSGILLVVSPQPRKDGTLACALVRIYLPGDEDPEQAASATIVGHAEWLALIHSEPMASDDDDPVYLVRGLEALKGEAWRNSGLKATPERWASIFQGTPKSGSGGAG